MSKIPKHLQEKIDKQAKVVTLEKLRQFSKANWAPANAVESGFLAGAAAMHSLILEELKPIVEALECYARDNAKTTTNECGTGVVTCMAEKALTHFKERIEAQNDPT